jgi:hypothetical protein
MTDKPDTVYVVLRVRHGAHCVACKTRHFWREMIGVYGKLEVAQRVKRLYKNDPHDIEVKPFLVQEDEGYHGVSNVVTKGPLCPQGVA